MYRCLRDHEPRTRQTKIPSSSKTTCNRVNKGPNNHWDVSNSRCTYAERRCTGLNLALNHTRLKGT